MTFETKTPVEAKQYLDGGDGWTYVDVRTVEEYESGHVLGAFNIPVMVRTASGMAPNPDFVTVVKKHFQPETRMILGCAMGGRSQRACQLMDQEGFQNLVNMYGGFQGARDPAGQLLQEGWQGLGYPTETGSDEKRGYSALADT